MPSDQKATAHDGIPHTLGPVCESAGRQCHCGADECRNRGEQPELCIAYVKGLLELPSESSDAPDVRALKGQYPGQQEDYAQARRTSSSFGDALNERRMLSLGRLHAV